MFCDVNTTFSSGNPNHYGVVQVATESQTSVPTYLEYVGCRVRIPVRERITVGSLLGKGSCDGLHPQSKSPTQGHKNLWQGPWSSNRAKYQEERTLISLELHVVISPLFQIDNILYDDNLTTLYQPPALTLKSSAFCPRTVLVRFVRFSEWTPSFFSETA
jgi:hypothetical protein